MAGGELFDPLGTDRTPSPRPGPSLSTPVVAAGLAVVALVALLAVAWLRDDGDRGLPRAVSTIEQVARPQAPSAPSPAPAQPAPMLTSSPTQPAAAPAVRDDQEVEIQNGVRIIRPRRAPTLSGGSTIVVPGSPLPAQR